MENISQDNELQRVDKVTVLIGDDDDCAKISLYRNNEKLGETDTDVLHIPTYDQSGLPNKVIYQNYCKDYMINLLNNGGVDGFYYEPKQDTQTIQYDKSVFISTSISNIKQSISDMLNKYNIEIYCNVDENNITTDRYKNSFIKNAECLVGTKITNITTNKNLIVIIKSNIRSGQLCKPKIMLYNGEEMQFNYTNINKLFKGI